MNENKTGFKIVYSAPTAEERREIEGIRKEYLPSPKEQSKLQRLKKLDFRVRGLPKLIAFIVGIAGVLIFGTGLCTVLEWNIISWGVVIMTVGAIITAAAYPLYRLIYTRAKRKHTAEILSISGELLESGQDSDKLKQP